MGVDNLRERLCREIGRTARNLALQRLADALRFNRRLTAETEQSCRDIVPRIRDAGVGPDTLRNGSYLYDALLGYTYIDSCGAQLAHLGQPSSRELDASTWLHEACAHLHHASVLFTRAVKIKRSSLLVAAASEALATAPLLRKARASLTELR